MPLVKPASHRLCGKCWTNDINTKHNHPSRIKPVSDNRNVGFHIAGIVVSANKNIHKELQYDGGDPMEFRDYLVKVQKACKGEWSCWH